jgi:hypothetical protein
MPKPATLTALPGREGYGTGRRGAERLIMAGVGGVSFLVYYCIDCGRYSNLHIMLWLSRVWKPLLHCHLVVYGIPGLQVLVSFI